jgi:hypothetical protein
VDVIINKVEWTISNPAIYSGCTATVADAEPEILNRSIPAIVPTCTIGIKYDANTANFWEKRAAGTDIVVSLLGTDIGISGSYARITSDIAPAGGEEGTFYDLALQFAGTSSGTVVNYKIGADA